MFDQKLNPAVCGTEKQSQVDQQTGQLENAIGNLHDRIESLASRLRPVLNQSDQKGAGVPSVPEPVLVPHAERLRSAEKSVREANSKIEMLLRMIEL